MAQMRIIKPNKFLDVFYPNEEQLFCWAGDAAWGKALVSSRDAEMIVLGPLDSQVPRPPMRCHSYTGYNVLHAPSLLLHAPRSDYHRRKYKQCIVSWCHDLFQTPQSPKISCKGPICLWFTFPRDYLLSVHRMLIVSSASCDLRTICLCRASGWLVFTCPGYHGIPVYRISILGYSVTYMCTL